MSLESLRRRSLRQSHRPCRKTQGIALPPQAAVTAALHEDDVVHEQPTRRRFRLEKSRPHSTSEKTVRPTLEVCFQACQFKRMPRYRWQSKTRITKVSKIKKVRVIICGLLFARSTHACTNLLLSRYNMVDRSIYYASCNDVCHLLCNNSSLVSLSAL